MTEIGEIEAMRDKLIRYVWENISSEFDPVSDELIVYLDSVSLLQFSVFIEEISEVQIDPAVVGLEPFETLDSLCEWLASRSAKVQNI